MRPRLKLDQDKVTVMIDNHHEWLYNTGLSGFNTDRRSNGIKANFAMNDLSNIDLSRSDLSYAKFNHAVLHGVNFTDCDLYGADLRDAEFTIELLTARSLLHTTMSWSQAPWVSSHPDFDSIKFV